MSTDIIEARTRTTKEGVLNLSLNVGIPDADVAVIVHVKPLASTQEVDANGWPMGFFDQVAGSMPELQRAPQGPFEERLALD